MNKVFKKIFHERYGRVVVTVYSLIILFRVVETTMLLNRYGVDDKVIGSEIFGLFFDILGSSIFIISYILISSLLSRIGLRFVKILNVSLLLLSSLIFLLIIKFFVYQRIPLDIFLYQYTFQEVSFTVNTSSINLYITTISIIVLLIFVMFIAWLFSRTGFSKPRLKLLYSVVLVSLPLFFVISQWQEVQSNKYSLNKPVYFIERSIEYVMSTQEDVSPKTNEFRRLYPNKEFLSSDYSLIHKVNRVNELGKYFHEFEGKPNIVLIIAEGLNDDFIHEYMGTSIMPFLSQLKNKSLYWNRCFTLGERSFAAVPSIIGGLPYGEIGFTMEKRIPRHLSLVSILKSNDYYTSFFYGQGSWFHNKQVFFESNDIDFIFDCTKFSNKYSKIFVGEGKSFWGYNDKDLFDQSLTVLDTLNQAPKFTIYFTGSMHPPYIISDKSQYDKRLLGLSDQHNREFFKTYSEYLTTVLFADDALSEFFNGYEKRDDYENTIFIITGDHPVTDVPIKNSLKRYHVPLIIFSDKLKESQIFTHTVSHLDISETILSFLEDDLSHLPNISTSLGEQLFDNDQEFTKNLAFMNTNREVIDFLSGDYYLSGDKLYDVDSELSIEETENDFVKSLLLKRLDAFNSTCLYSTRKNMVISSEDYCRALHLQNLYSSKTPDTITTSSEYYELSKNLKIPNSDFVFDISLDLSKNKNKEFSIVCEVLNSKDSLLYWKSIGVEKDRITQIHFPMKRFQVPDSNLTFRSYLWNQGKTDFTISDLNVLLYKSNSHNTGGNVQKTYIH